MLKELLESIRKTSSIKSIQNIQPTVVAPPTAPVAPKLQLSTMPTPETVAPASPADISSRDKVYDETTIMKLLRGIRGKYRPEMSLSEMAEEIVPPDWIRKNNEFNLWEEALARFQSELDSPQPVKEMYPSMSEQQLMQEAAKYSQYPKFNELPKNIKENDWNRERFYEILSEQIKKTLFLGESDIVADKQSDKVSFKEPFAEMFYQSYLSPSAENTDQFFAYLSTEGPRGASAIDRLDDVFTRIPSGFRSANDKVGQKYDSIIGYYSSKKTGGYKELADMGIEVPETDSRSVADIARWISTNPDVVSELESDFGSKMMSQDLGVFNYIKKSLNPTFDRAADFGTSTVGSGGEDIVFDEKLGTGDTSYIANESIGEGVAAEETDIMRHSLLTLPEKFETLGDRLRELLQNKASMIPQDASPKYQKQKEKLQQLGYLTDSYTSAMRKSLKQMFEKVQSGDITKSEIDNMKKGGLIRIKTELGDFKWTIDKNKSTADLEFDKILSNTNTMLFHFIADLDSSLKNPKLTNDILSKNGIPLDREKLNTDEKYGRNYQQKLFMMAQMLIDYVGPEILEMMNKGEVDKETVVGFLGMLKPHAMPKAIAPYLSGKYSDEDRRNYLKSRVNKSWNTYQKDVEKAKKTGEEPSRKQPSVSPHDIDEMSDAKIRSVLFELIPKDERARIGDYLAKIHDHGEDYADESKWPAGGNKEWKKRHNLAMARYNILFKAANQIGNLMDVKSKLIRYASVSHINDMIKTIVSDAKRKLSRLEK